MYKNIFTLTKLLIVLCSMLLCMTIVTYFFDRNIFYVEFVINIILIVITTFVLIKSEKYITKFVNHTIDKMDLKDGNNLLKFNVPMVTTYKNGDIIWVNEHFKASFNLKDKYIGNNIVKYTGGIDAKNILNKNYINVKYEDKYYISFGIKLDESMIFYFIDDTYQKQIIEEFKTTRPAIVTILFDNKEELLNDRDDEQVTQILAMVENILQKWGTNTNSFLKKISEDRYIMFTEEKYIKQFIDNKFDILDEIHNVKIDEHNYATISIGIGRGAESLKQCEIWSRKALDMALGRGGDQAVIKKGDSYEFFGGSSKSIEKRDAVRARVISYMLINHIKNCNNVFIMGHRFSDLDSVGASIGMWSALKKGQKKDAYIVIDSDNTLASTLVNIIKNNNEQKVFIKGTEAMNMVDEKSLLIVVDTHNPDFLESKELYQKFSNVVVIDHHRLMVNRIKNALIFFHEPYASSTAEMVTQLIQYLGEDTLNRIEAEALLAGIMLDTKNFILRTGVKTFEVAAFLRTKGADTVEVKRMFNNTIDNYKAKFELVSQAEIFNGCAVVCANEDEPDLRLVSSQAADELLSIQDVKASFVLYQVNDIINISARSLGDVNVQVIMEKLGGGGHQTMAGTQMKDTTIMQARQDLINILNNIKI